MNSKNKESMTSKQTLIEKRGHKPRQTTGQIKPPVGGTGSSREARGGENIVRK